MSSACHWGSTAVRGGEVDSAVVLGERGFDRGIDATARRRRRLGALRPRLVIVRRVDGVPAPPHRTEHVGAVLGAIGVEDPLRRQQAPRVVGRDGALPERRPKRPKYRQRGHRRRVEGERRPPELVLDERGDVRLRAAEFADGVRLHGRGRALSL